MLNDIVPLIDDQKARDLLARLEKDKVEQALPAEMELAILWALSRIGDLDIEPEWWGDNKRPDAYTEHLATLNWLAADGDDNRVIFVRRRDGGGCDGLQMVAFYDETKPAEATAPGYLGFAVIPGDVCTATPAAPTTPSGGSAQ